MEDDEFGPLTEAERAGCLGCLGDIGPLALALVLVVMAVLHHEDPPQELPLIHAAATFPQKGEAERVPPPQFCAPVIHTVQGPQVPPRGEHVREDVV